MSAIKQTAIIALLTALASPAAAEPIDPADIRVIDGDTIQIFGVEPNVRLVGFDAPEPAIADSHVFPQVADARAG